MAFIPRMASVALAAAIALAGCGGDDDASTPATSTSTPTTAAATTPSSSTTSTTTGDEGVELTQSCTHDERSVRVTVRYPRGWHVNDQQGVPPCSAFDPDPVELRAGSEFARTLAVVLRVEPISLDAVATGTGLRVETERRLTVDGRPAARQEVVSTGEGLDPAGVRSTRYVIDGGADRSILATTYDVEGNDFERSVEVLDAMTAALEVQPRNP